ncbi:unnamed protein product [Ceutorhynchus assimilis]|uniref:Glycoside hydrolase family 31 n=1 Tax=Ceutorhynchus assimilis TaxID=467358 RepID=A0A9N9MR93_9CUCU|nr:unnamed protein product [Ceutorhynchus assimilis]
MKKSAIIILLLFCGTFAVEILKDTTGKVSLQYNIADSHIDVELIRGEKTHLTGRIGKNKNVQQTSCIGKSLCQINPTDQLQIQPIENGFNITWSTNSTDNSFIDCHYLNATSTNWFGGPQRYYQAWPVEKLVITASQPYVVRRDDNFGVAERYWLNSHGTYIFLDDRVPLWVDQNNQHPDQVCFIAEAKSPYINRQRVVLSYVVVALDDAKTAHLDAVNNHLGKPSAYPNEKMIGEPIWTTWAKYKKPINDKTVLEFAGTIREQGYQGGQLEIDDNWETCYGSQQFDPKKFSNITSTVQQLHEDNWRVSLWIHPFVDDDCQNNSAIGQQSGYFVRNTTNQTLATWWNSDDAHQIDFTQSAAAKWWSDRLTTIQNKAGIDSFKFDAGETDYMNQPPVYDDVEYSPNILNQKYIDTCNQFGDLIEFRSSFRGQKYGRFIRMLDKDSVWDLNNGLATLITTLLQLNMNGYAMVLPDMIGGNGYRQQPTPELIVRWMQANTFMPSMQFSYLPWDYKDEVSYEIEDITRKFIDLHTEYAPKIVEAMKKNVLDGSPVNPPVWWSDPSDVTALAIADEYLLGDDVLVAPVIVQGATSRDVYLPKGEWKDGNNGAVYSGPTTLINYYAPIDVLPYFVRQ